MLGTVSVLMLLFILLFVGDGVFVGICVCGSIGAYTSVGVSVLVFVFVTIGGNLCVGDEMSGKDVNSLTLPQNARYTNLEFARKSICQNFGRFRWLLWGILPTSSQIQIQIK